MDSKDKWIAWKIARRIACPEGEYPASEAKYDSVLEYIHDLERKVKYMKEVLDDSRTICP